MKITKGSLWLGKEWEDAIKLSLETPDCGVEPFDGGYQIYSWGNGYRRKYHTKIPTKYNEFVIDLLRRNDGK